MINSHFYIGHQATSVPVLLAAWSTVLDRGGKSGVCFGPPIFLLGGNTYFRLACYLKTSRKCAGLCVRWAEVSMTCTDV